MNINPSVSILIINYNGKNLLNDCLSSLRKINYPNDKYEIILVDNNSQDDSVSFIKKNFPEVSLFESKENLGFTGGNNLAITNAKGDYVVLLNNDTVVDKNWLKELVKTAENESVGIVTSKLYFDIPYIEMEIISGTDVKSNIYKDSQEYNSYGLIIDSINCDTAEKNYYIWHKRGFYEPVDGNYTSRWTDGHGVVLLPFVNKDQETYQISIHGKPNSFNEKTNYKIKINNKVVKTGSIPSKEVKQINVQVKREEVEKDLIYLVQNAGNVIFKNGLGRDRGSVIKRALNETKEFYDYDSDYYNKETNVMSMCGASCLIKREVLKDKNELFDPAYFMYYEDADLSLKTWRMGYDIVYEPKSIVYHKHRATTNKQTSAFFISNIDKNHLFFLLTHFPMKIFYIQFVIFLIKYITAVSVVNLSEFVNYYGRVYKNYSVKLEARKKAFEGFMKHYSRIKGVRKELEKNQKRGIPELFNNLY